MDATTETATRRIIEREAELNGKTDEELRKIVRQNWPNYKFSVDNRRAVIDGILYDEFGAAALSVALRRP